MGFWKFASDHPFITLFGLWAVVGGVVALARPKCPTCPPPTGRLGPYA